jgi:uncharacterized protein YbgA (DUF1722 family)
VLGSHDLEDIINVVGGRVELVAEIAAAAPELRQYLAEHCRAWLSMQSFIDALPSMIQPDEMLDDRLCC